MKRWAWAISLITTALVTAILYSMTRDPWLLLSGAITFVIVLLTVRVMATLVGHHANDWIRKRWGA
jgi:hypothetical protein